MLHKLIGVLSGLESRAKYDAKIEYVKHRQLAAVNAALIEPRSHLGNMIGDRQVSGARDDDCLQDASPTERITRKLDIS